MYSQDMSSSQIQLYINYYIKSLNSRGMIGTKLAHAK